MIPLVEALTPPPDPIACCERLEGLPYRIFFDSAVRGSPLGRYSFLTADPVAVILSKGARMQCPEPSRALSLEPSTPVSPIVARDALGALRSWLAPHAAEPVEGLPPFQGGAAGYLAYDWGRTLERVAAPRYDDLGIPDAVLGIYDWVIAWDHDRDAAWLVSTGLPETSPAARSRRSAERAAAVRRRLGSPSTPGATDPTDFLPLAAGPHPRRELFADASPRISSSSARHSRRRTHSTSATHEIAGWWSPRLTLRSSFTHAGYLAAVDRVREYILAGDIFQANLSQRFEAALPVRPWTLYRNLRAQNGAPFAAYLDFPEAVVLSASPERFLRAGADGHVETRPIKGTGPRGFGPEHDAALGAALVESPKDRAENLMIVDLMRNDLSRVCSAGSVRVRELCALEHYATVHHLVSTVIGTLAPGSDALDLLRATFPGGSITGAPKIRAMEIIAELEPSERGVYCGSIGYWSVTGALDSNIAIRTALVQGDRVSFSAGGGIVADSEPEREYRETLDKARGMIDALAASG